MNRFALLVMLTALGLTACQTAPAPSLGSTATKLDNNPMTVGLPAGIDAPPPIPADNPITPAKVELGRQLFFDARLSSDRSVSCATCHNPVMGFADGRRTSMGTRGQVGGRSAPTVINLAYATGGVFWDGRAASLEEQAKGPIQNPIEMSNTHKNVVATLNALPGYRSQFEHVFGSPEITIDNVAKAIAAFERVIISGNSPWDRFMKGDQTALSEEARRGRDLFQTKANCIRCHAGFNLTNNQFRNIGVGFDGPNPDLGRYEFTRNDGDRGRFKTPTLREITFTAPYMHDGSEPTLEGVIEYYDRGGNPNPYLDSDIEPLHLSKQEKADLLAFLHSLNGEGWKVQAPIQLPPDNDSRK
jgi:cytochrome c peroxidase